MGTNKVITKCELFHDSFQNWKSHNIPAKAQLVIADIPYNLGNAAYGSNPMWYVGGTTRTERATKQENPFSARTKNLTLPSISISAPSS